MTLFYLGFGGFAINLILILFFFFFVWVWAIIDLAKSDFKDSATKILWVLFIFFIPVLGVLLYVIVGRRQKVINNRSGQQF